MKSVLGRGISVFGESSCFLFAHELSCHMKLLFCMYAGIHRKQFCMALNSYKFYTTGIMTTMYRFDQLHSERKSLALLKDHEWGFDYMRSFKARHKRENCVFDTAPEPEA